MASTEGVSEVAGVKRMISPSGSTWWGGYSVDVGLRSWSRSEAVDVDGVHILKSDRAKRMQSEKQRSMNKVKIMS